LFASQRRPLPAAQPSPAQPQLPNYQAVASAVQAPLAAPVQQQQPPTDADDASDSAVPQGLQPRMTNHTRFSLDYELNGIAAADVADVELWATEDRGQTWRRWGNDPDQQSPLTVKVESEGVFGFLVVVVSNHGLASQAPQAGDDADVWIAVDTTDPVARLTSVVLGSGANLGKLDIRWTAADDHFPERPVTLAYGATPQGPWQPVASSLANLGQYTWRPTAEAPREFYLKLSVEDQAGNRTEHISPHAINRDSLKPRGRIRTLEAVPDQQAPARPASTSLDREASRSRASRRQG
jgi:hypothetical protein